MQDKIKYWVEIADYDFDTAIAMLESRRLLYVGFMCHQVIEKMIKAFWKTPVKNSYIITPCGNIRFKN